MAKQAKLSAEDEAFAEAEKALPMGSGVRNSGKGLAAPVRLTPEQEREAELLGKQDAARELERRGLKPPPVVETSLSADFSQVNRPGAVPATEPGRDTPPPPVPVQVAQAPAVATVEPAPPPPTLHERATIRTAGYDPRTGQIVDPERYARWRARNEPPASHQSPDLQSETGWFELRAKLPKPLPSPTLPIQAVNGEEAKREYCRRTGMNADNPSVEWEIKPCAAPGVAVA